jgi:hypothetical protein
VKLQSIVRLWTVQLLTEGDVKRLIIIGAAPLAGTTLASAADMRMPM